MLDINKEYIKEHGSCTFKKDYSLSEVTADIPDGYGVFILRENKEEGEILYVGYSGTIDKKTGKFKRQQLRKRINNKHGKQRRQDFLRQQMKEDSTLKEISIEWYILDVNKCFPSDVKADLLQSYFEKHHRLPRWNKTF
ncbi:hypothetical protein HDR65_02135 [bacterium]|nr:hypothetical protein [bacterium]